MATRLVQTLQFLVGLTMLVAGVAVVVPLVAEWRHVDASRPSVGSGDAAALPRPSPTLPVPAYQHAIPDPMENADWGGAREGSGMSMAADHGEISEPAPQGTAFYRPPPPPVRMPTGYAGAASSVPDLAPTYRSTVAIPPPPLLDAQSPPPVAPGWTTRGPQYPPPAVDPEMQSLPVNYTIHDGDDLTSLAIRLYGHPGAAAAIFAANRDRLSDPAILPIGVRLRLPPPWAVTSGGHANGRRTIEPGAGTGVETGGRSQFAPASVSRGWVGSESGSSPP